jgi:hypothetical protein
MNAAWLTAFSTAATFAGLGLSTYDTFQVGDSTWLELNECFYVS